MQMPLNERKIIQIILEECAAVPDRCKDYREELVNTISDIIQDERQHRVLGTNIQQKVSDKCNTLGQLLARERAPAGNRGGG
jgi:hypothetical protein